MKQLRDLMVATRNAHKAEEIRAMLGDSYLVRDGNEVEGLPAIEETGVTFLENATLKAVGISQAAEMRGSLVLADDSGLEVDALGGRPGVWSSSFGGVEGDDERNNERLLRELEGTPADARGARFRCVMVVARDGQVLADFEGAVEGRIADKMAGVGGFGYDPLFLPVGHDRTFAELGAAVKNGMSHRARALAVAKEWLESFVEVD